MITKHSIDLTRINDPCWAVTKAGECKLLRRKEPGCNSHRCPFYKPKDCRDWLRIEDRQGINLIPPEDI